MEEKTLEQREREAVEYLEMTEAMMPEERREYGRKLVKEYRERQKQKKGKR